MFTAKQKQNVLFAPIKKDKVIKALVSMQRDFISFDSLLFLFVFTCRSLCGCPCFTNLQMWGARLVLQTKRQFIENTFRSILFFL